MTYIGTLPPGSWRMAQFGADLILVETGGQHPPYVVHDGKLMPLLTEIAPLLGSLVKP
jgi:hypothetical protein